MKLYRVFLKGGGEYRESYVVANDATEAYNKVRKRLDEDDLCFEHEREMDSVTLIADDVHYPPCKTIKRNKRKGKRGR